MLNLKTVRVVLSKLGLASNENPYFCYKYIANFMSGHTSMGKGVVEPVDDVRVTNPPVNEELMA